MAAPGDLVYIACSDSKDVAFLPGTLSSVSGKTAVVRVEGKSADVEVPLSEVRQRFIRDDDSTCQDSTSLVHLNDATILDNLEARHAKDEIYTYTASVLLAVNPYKKIHNLYGDEQFARYRGKHIGALPPHPYAIADTAYRALMREKRNQGMLISGESGAGKTETAKIVMNYLAYASGATSELAAKIQARVLQAQPILESFGNASTMRNSNSSRFGKYNRVFFDESGTLTNANITTYLLESSRVVVHGDGERSYHCFYEMLQGLDDAQLAALQLDRKGDYRLISTRQVSGFDEKDKDNFAKTCSALKTVGLDDGTVDAMNQVLAGLLHLGNIPMSEETPTNASDDESKTVDVNEDSIAAAAAVLGMDPDELCTALKRKKVSVPGRDSFHMVPRTESQFRQALTSLIKALYNRLFDSTVQSINDSFRELSSAPQEGDGELNHIGILDIYGFERLQKNSFEQLCINLANERLQQYFIENVLGAEQTLYTREGLPWNDLALPDSQPVVNCISKVFLTLDEFSQKVAKGFEQTTDEKFCEKMVSDATKDPQRKDVLKHLKMSNKRNSTTSQSLNDGFIIKHYAGQVEYSTKGWLDKNNDRLLSECEALIADSTVPFIKGLADRDQGKSSFRSISKKYQENLEGLLTTLSTCNLHYIRCFKPNEEQKPRIFKQPLVLDQIVQCGTIELVKIMHDGYPNRCPFDEIAERFKSLLPPSFQRYGTRTFIEALMLAYEVPRDQWELGMSRLFLKAGQLKALEDMRSNGVKPDADKLKAIVSKIIRKKWVRAVNSVKLCLYIPKFIEQIKAKRAKEALSRAALTTALLAPRLEAVRRRIQERKLRAKRRLMGAIRTVCFVSSEWSRIKEQRAERLRKALCLAAFIHRQVRPWVEGARARAADAAQRREAERRREEERRRIEDEKRAEEHAKEQERQRVERERLEQERLRLEEERQEEEARREEERKEEEARAAERAVEQQRQMEEEQKKRQEEFDRAKVEEEQRLRENAAKNEAEWRKIQEERQKLEEEKKALAQERQTRKSLMAPPTPVRNRNSTDGPQSPTVVATEEEPTKALAQAEVKKEIEDEMNKRIEELTKEFERKQSEVMQQMSALKDRNEVLERAIEEEKEPLDNSPGRSSCMSPQADRSKASPLPLDNGTPPSTPPRSSTSGRRLSLISGVSASPNNSGGESTRSKRMSIASMALGGPLPGNPAAAASRAGAGLGGGNGGVKNQRAWWAQQRSFLLEDLGGMGGLGDLGGLGRAGRRASMVAASEPAVPRVENPQVPAVDEEEEVDGGNKTRCNLSEQFGCAGSSKQEASGMETKMRKPQVHTKKGGQFTLNMADRRRSVGQY